MFTDYTVSGATNSGDVYTCTIPANGTFADVVIHPIDDSAEEGVENLSVTMIEEETIGSSTPAFMVVEEDKKAEAAINDNEGLTVKLELKNSGKNVQNPENEDYVAEKEAADGLDQLGAIEAGKGRTGKKNEFTNITLMEGTVSNLPAGAQLRWKRMINSRSVLVRYLERRGEWVVSWRFDRQDNDTGHDAYNDPVPSPGTNKIYMWDNSAEIVFDEFIIDGLLNVGDYIHTEKCFTYSVEMKVGDDWKEIGTKTVSHIIDLKRVGNANNNYKDFERVTDKYIEEAVDAKIDKKEIRSLVGGEDDIIIGDNVNKNHSAK